MGDLINLDEYKQSRAEWLKATKERRRSQLAHSPDIITPDEAFDYLWHNDRELFRELVSQTFQERFDHGESMDYVSPEYRLDGIDALDVEHEYNVMICRDGPRMTCEDDEMNRTVTFNHAIERIINAVDNDPDSAS